MKTKPPQLTKVEKDGIPGAYAIVGWDALELWACENIEGFSLASKSLKGMADEDKLTMLLGMMIHRSAEGEKHGRIHERNADFMVKILGVAADKDGNKFRLCIHSSRNYPLVVSEKTGRIFEITWEQICKLALSQGIDGG